MKVLFAASFVLLCLCSITQSVDQVLQPFYNVSNNPCNKSKTVNLLVMAPFPDPTEGLNPGTDSGPIVVPAAIMAADLINERCDVLEDYRIELVVVDSGCEIMTKAISSLVNATFDELYQVVGIVGPSCSETAIEVGAFLAHPKVDLLHISPSATSPRLLDLTAFPNTFRTLSSSLGFIAMYVALINELQVKRVAVFFEHVSSVQALAALTLQRRLEEENDVSVMLLGMSDFLFPLDQIRSRYRWVFVFGGREIARKLVCLAFRKGMIYPNYQFFFTEIQIQDIRGSASDIITVNYNGETFQCTGGPGDMSNATVGIMLSDFELRRKDGGKQLVDNRTLSAFFEDYRRSAVFDYVEQIGLNRAVAFRATLEPNSHQTGYYDSVWAFALALNASISRLENELNASLSSYTYGNPQITDIIRSELLKVSFEGTRGRVNFSKDKHDGENVTRIAVTNLISRFRRTIAGEFDPSLQLDGQINISNQSLFIPDSFEQIIIAPPIYIEAIVLTVVVFLAVVLVVLHVINLKWPAVQSIKVTSPLLNNLIFSGCYIYLVSIFFLSFKEITGIKNPVLFSVKCSSFLWCESLAYSLIFGTICLKTWRILRIFSSASAKVHSHLDNHFLVLYICLIALFDVIHNVLWNTINPWFMEAETDEQKIVLKCRSGNLTLWISTLLAHKAVLTIAVLYMSIATRQVPKKEYKQTKSTNMLVYIFVLLNSLLLPVHILLLDSSTILSTSVSYVALCLKNILCVTMCIVLIFIPPVLPIFKTWWRKR